MTQSITPAGNEWSLDETIDDMLASMSTYELLEFRYMLGEDHFREVADPQDQDARTHIMRSMIYRIELEVGKRWNRPHNLEDGLPTPRRLQVADDQQ